MIRRERSRKAVLTCRISVFCPILTSRLITQFSTSLAIFGALIEVVRRGRSQSKIAELQSVRLGDRFSDRPESPSELVKISKSRFAVRRFGCCHKDEESRREGGGSSLGRGLQLEMGSTEPERTVAKRGRRQA